MGKTLDLKKKNIEKRSIPQTGTSKADIIFDYQ